VSATTRTLPVPKRPPLRKILNARSLQQGAGLVLMYVIILVVASVLSPYFLSTRNFLNLLLASSTIGMIAIFTTMLMVGGGLDLSVGSTVALAGVVISHTQYALGVWGAVAAGIGIGLLIGGLNGLIVTRVGINPLITTLGMLSVARGLAFVLSGGLSEPMLDPTFGVLGRGSIAGVPVPVLVLLVLFVGAFIVMHYTTYGRAMYAIGGNLEASYLAGLPVKRYQLIAYILSGLSAAVAGVFLTSQLGAGAPQAAFGLELSVIAAVVLGGTSLAGGKGTLFGTLIGVLILGTLNNGMVLLSMSSYYQQVAQGLVLLLAVGLDQLRIGSIGRSTTTKSFRVGFAALNGELPATIEMRAGLEQAALHAGDLSLRLVENRLDEHAVQSSAERLIAEKVDLAIVAGINEQACSQLVSRFREAGIPVIAVDTPAPGALFFGADNHRAGWLAGEALGAWIQAHWGGQIDRLIALGEPGAGRALAARLQGQRDGLEAAIGPITDDRVISLDAHGSIEASQAQVEELLASLPGAHKLAVICFSDESALGAVAAAGAAGRLEDIVVVGQGASRLAREEIRASGSRLIGSVMYAPERYGERLLQIARQVLAGDQVPPALYVEHAFINRENIDVYYPELTE